MRYKVMFMEVRVLCLWVFMRSIYKLVNPFPVIHCKQYGPRSDFSLRSKEAKKVCKFSQHALLFAIEASKCNCRQYSKTCIKRPLKNRQN